LRGKIARRGKMKNKRDERKRGSGGGGERVVGDEKQNFPLSRFIFRTVKRSSTAHVSNDWV
jgi:hypothetical protein